jgi:signal transduction histidine kinase
MPSRLVAAPGLGHLYRLAARFAEWPVTGQADPKSVARARLVVLFAFVFGLVGLTYAIISAVFGRHVVAMVAGFYFCLMVATPLIMRRSRSASLGINVIILGGWLVVGFIALMSGGLEAPIVGWLALIPCGAIFLDGPRSAKVWLAICLVTVAVLCGLELIDAVPVEPRSDALVLRRALSLALVIGLLVLMMFFYDATRTSLLAELHQKNEALAAAHNELASSHAELSKAHGELAAAHARLVQDGLEQRRLELDLRQAQKLEAVGRLAAGVAHELNTPLQFVSDSVAFVDESVRDLITALDRYRKVVEDAVPADVRASNDGAIERLSQTDAELDLPFLIKQTPDAIRLSKDGIARMADIVRAMKEFAYADSADLVLMDVNQALANTLTISRAEYRTCADVVTHFGALPAINCRAGEVSQVFLNLIVNAGHAIEDRMKETGERGVITVTTGLVEGRIEVCVSDTGTGIPEGVRERIFDPFFTTKTVGRGSGQGLAISRSVIVDKHGGSLDFETEVGRGTTFRVRLALDPVPMASAA